MMLFQLQADQANQSHAVGSANFDCGFKDLSEASDNTEKLLKLLGKTLPRESINENKVKSQ